MVVIPVLSTKDIGILRGLVHKEKERIAGSRPGYSPADEVHQAPECYVVKLPDGIDALSPDDPDVPGEETGVSAYQVMIVGGDPELHETGVTIDLLNLGGPLTQAYWALATRDKFGRWVLTHVAKYECVYGLVKGAIAAGDTTFIMDNVVVMQGVSPLDDPTDTAEELAIQHMTGLPAANNAKAVAWFDETNEVWRGIPFYVNVDCEE